MTRIAVVGCGKIADQHVRQIQRIRSSILVAVCDKEELLAEQLSDRFGVQYYFSDVRRMLEVAKPTVVHITTPPQSHYELGMLCLKDRMQCLY